MRAVTDCLDSVQAMKLVTWWCDGPCPFPDPWQRSLGNTGNAPGLGSFLGGLLEDGDRDWTTLRGLGLSAAPRESAPGWLWAGGSSRRRSGEGGVGLELDMGGRR